jgi:hypothetical protein
MSRIGGGSYENRLSTGKIEITPGEESFPGFA